MDRPILQVLADNPGLFEAVKETILEEFALEEARTDDGMSDERLGQMFRARLVGIKKIEEAFKKIARYRKRADVGGKINTAR